MLRAKYMPYWSCFTAPVPSLQAIRQTDAIMNQALCVSSSIVQYA